MIVVHADVIAKASELAALREVDPDAYTTFDIAVLAIMDERERCIRIVGAGLGKTNTSIIAEIQRGEDAV